MAGTSSLLSSFSLGKQSAKDTAATKYKTALALTSGGGPEFDIREPRLEHPAPTNRVTTTKTPPQRTGYRVPVNASFLFHPRFFGMALMAAGFKHTTVASTGYYTHTFVLANRNEVAYVSAILGMVADDGSEFERLVKDFRATNLTMDASVDEIETSIEGFGLKESLFVAGAETFLAETSVEISPSEGSLTLTILGESIASPVRGSQFVVEQAIRDDDRVLWSSVRQDAGQQSIACRGTLSDIDVDFGAFTLYRTTVYGDPAGTDVVLTPCTGAIAYSFESPTVIPTTAVPYSFGISVPTASFILDAIGSSGDDNVRCNVNWEMIDDGATPISIVLVNDVVSYVA